MLRSLLPRSQLVSNLVPHQHVAPSVVIPRASSYMNRSTTPLHPHPLPHPLLVADRSRPTTFMGTPSRSFHTTRPTSHGGKGRPKEGQGQVERFFILIAIRNSQTYVCTHPNDRSITLHFKKPNGEIETVQANEGDDIVDVSWEYDLDIEAACEKSVACSTCHVILEDDVYDKLEEPSDDENDMLDLAFGLTDTSRLGCQIKVTKDFDGTTITLPSATRNLRVDGSKPTPH